MRLNPQNTVNKYIIVKALSLANIFIKNLQNCEKENVITPERVRAQTKCPISKR